MTTKVVSPTKEQLDASVALAKKLWPSSFVEGEPMFPKLSVEDSLELHQHFKRMDALKARCLSNAYKTPKRRKES
jgi:hypothetical protein